MLNRISAISHYLREEVQKVSEDARKEILTLIKNEPGMTLKTLLGEIQHKLSRKV